MSWSQRRCPGITVLSIAAATIVLSASPQFILAQEEVSDAELEKLIQAQVQRLSSEELETRRAASEELGKLCDRHQARAKSCIPALVKCLAEEDPQILEAAVTGLRHCGEPAVNPLVECLASRIPLVRANAAAAFYHFGWLRPDVKCDQALAPLRRLLRDADADVREAAIEALGELGDTNPSTLAQIKVFLTSATNTDRTGALEAIISLSFKKDPAEILKMFKEPVLTTLEDEDADVRSSAIVALDAMTLPAMDLLPILIRCLSDPAEQVRETCLATLKSLPADVDRSAAIPKLVALLDTDEENLASICSMLGEFGPQAKTAVPGLKKALQSLDVFVVAQAAEALWLIDKQSADSIPALERFLQRGNLADGEIICDAIFTLGPAAAPLTKYIVKLLKSGDWDVQWGAAGALYAIAPDDQETISVLIDYLGHESHQVAGTTAAALGKIGLKAVPSLIAATKTGSVSQREYAADALGRIGPTAKDAIEPLKRLLTNEERSLRVWGAIALAKIEGRAEVVPQLIEVLLDDKEVDTVRQQAAIALGKIGPKAKGAVPALRAMLKEEDETLQQAADEALKAIGE